MQKLVFRNGNGVEINLTAGDYGITEWEGFSANELNIQSQQVPFQDGAVFLDALMEQRELNVTLAIKDDNDLERRYRNRRELISVMNPKLGEGVLIYTNNFISKQIHVIPQIPLFENHNSNDAGTPKARLSWTACNPYWEDLEDTVVNINGDKKITNNGDYKTAIELIIPDGVQNVTFINQTNKQKLQAIGLSEGITRINTDFGKKTVLSEDVKIKYASGGSFTDVITVGTKVYLLANSLLVYDFIEDTYEEYPLPFSVTKMAYSSQLNLFCFVGEKIGTSQNLLDWTVYTPSRYCDDCIYAKGKFYVVSETSIYSSEDGVNWNVINEGGVSIAYSSEEDLFCLVKEETIKTSSDAITWTSVYTIALSNVSARKVKWLNNNFVVLAGGSSSGYYNDGYVITSFNGIDWSISNKLSNAVFLDIEYSTDEGLYILCGREYMSISQDLSSCEIVFTTNWTFLIKSICFNETYKFYFSCGDMSIFLMSSSGLEWTKKLYIFERLSTTFEPQYLSFAKDRFAIGDSSYYYTFDGFQWVENQQVFTMKDLIYAKGNYISLFNTGISKSQDYVNWQRIVINSNENFKKLCYGANKVVLLSSEKIYVNANEALDDWQAVYQNNEYSLQSVCYSESLGIFVAIGYATNTDRSIFLRSSDGVNWQESVFQNTYGTNRKIELYSIATNNNLFVAIGRIRGSINSENYEHFITLTTNDAQHILEKKFSSDINPRKIFFCDLFFCLIGGQGEGDLSGIYITIDGKNIIKKSDLTIINGAYGNGFIYLLKPDNSFEKSYPADIVNNIEKLTKDSNISLVLEVGQNDVLYTDDKYNNCILKYRQKYIGV